MKTLVFGIFAHPDDEAFGPSATLYRAAQSGADVHLVLVTDGESGTNPDNDRDLAQTRLMEWRKSSELIGVHSGVALHYPDGGLSNNLYLEIAEKIIEHIQKTLDTYEEPVSVEFITFEPGGITGHLDHIAVSHITTFVYLRFREQQKGSVEIGKLKYYCLPHSMATAPATNWIYMPCGKEKSEVDECTDFSDIAEKKLEIMRAHYTQRSDMEQILSHQNTDNPDCLCDHFTYFKD